MVHNKAGTEEVVPEMRAALARATYRLDKERFVKDLVEEGTVGLARSAYTRQGFSHVVCVSDLVSPGLVTPSRSNFSIRMVISWGSRCNATWRESRKKSAADSNVVRDRDATLASRVVGDRRSCC